MPLDYCMRIINGLDTRTGQPLTEAQYKREAARRDDMAKHATSFLHSKLSSIELTGQGGGPIKTSVDPYKLSIEELMQLEHLLSKSMVTINADADAATLEIPDLTGTENQTPPPG